MTETTTERVKPELTGWKKALLAGAAVFLMIGGGLQAMGGGAEDDAPGDGAVVAETDQDPGLQDPGTGEPGSEGVTSLPKSALVDDQGTPIGTLAPQDDSPKIQWPPPGAEGVPVPQKDPAPENGDETKAEPGAAGWSPFFLKGGFSFFAAFCVGYATRVWLKMMAFFLGTFFIGIFLLSYAGALDPNWIKIEGWYDLIVARIESEAVDFKTFLTGSLPQAGMAGLGLVAGFKRK